MQITTPRIFIYLLAIAAICFLAWFFSTIISYILIAGVLSLVANPLCRRIDNFKIYKGKSLSSGARALITLLIVIIIFLGVIGAFVPVLIAEVDTISNIDQQRVIKNFEQPLQQLQSAYQYLNLGDGKSFSEFVTEGVKKIVNPQFISQFVSRLFSSTGDIVTAIFSILFIAFFFLKDEKLLLQTLLMLFPEKHKERATQIFDDSKKQLVNYFQGLLIQFAAVTTMAAIGMWIVGVENAILMGVLFGFLNIIPYVGPLIASGLGVIIAVSTNLYLDVYTQLAPLVFKVIVVYGVVQFIDNWFLSNYIFSKSVEAHPLELFIVILASATVGGVVGMMVAIPVYCVLRIAVKGISDYLKTTKVEVA